MIKTSTKMKPFFWKRVILAEDAPDTIIWKRIKDMPIDQKEIEDLYTDARANAPVEATSGSVKVTGPTKRTFFTGEENQKLGIGLSQLPRPDILKEAIISFNEKTVSSSQIGTLLRVWPKESDINDLEKEELAEGEIWDKGEAYMINLCQPESILPRLKVWQFKPMWAEEKEIIETFYTRISHAYNEIEKNKYFL